MPAGYIKLLIIFGLLVGVAWFLGRTELFYQIPEDAGFMEPALKPKSVTMRERAPSQWVRGGAVMFLDPTSGKERVSRIMALPGDQISAAGGTITVNGQPIPDPHGQEEGWRPTVLAPIRVPANHVILLNDERGEARSARVDSRMLGPVHIAALGGLLEE